MLELPMKAADIFARAEAEKDRRLEAMYERNQELAAERDRNRTLNRAKSQILACCWLCGQTHDLPQGLTTFSLGLPLGTIEGVLCADCRATPGDMPEVVTRRLWAATELPGKWGWKPIPSRQARAAVRMGYAVTADGEPVAEVTWTTAAPWHEYCWAFRVFTVRRSASQREHDPTPPRKPFGWLQ